MTDKFNNEPEVIEALNNGKKIQAIKSLRESRGIGLKEAKDLVENYIETHGLTELQQKNSGSIQGFIFFVVLAVMAYYIFKNYI